MRPGADRPATPEERRRLERVAGQAEATARALGISRNTLTRALRRHLGANPQMGDEQFVELIARVGRQVREGQRTIERLRQDIVGGPDAEQRRQAERMLLAAETAFDDGRLEDARAGFAEVRGLLRELLRIERERLEVRVAAWLGAIEAEANAATLLADFRGAADIFLSAAEDEPTLAVQRRWRLVASGADSLRQLGEATGDSATLERAIELYRRVAVPMVPAERYPEEAALTQADLGFALQALGTRLDDVSYLHEAIAAFETANAYFTLEADPAMWAMLQNSVGMAYMSLGRRALDGALLQRAVTAFESALAVPELSRTPLEWSMTQNNLGLSLQGLGIRARSADLLRRALQAFDAAESRLERSRDPIVWGLVQNSRGLTLFSLGSVEQQHPHFEAAAIAFGEALSAVSEERIPAYHSSILVNLGWALFASWKLTGSETTFGQAEAAFTRALATDSFEDSPMELARALSAMAVIDAIRGRQSANQAQLDAAEAKILRIEALARSQNSELIATLAQAARAEIASLPPLQPQAEARREQ